jgi:hypothetical protein
MEQPFFHIATPANIFASPTANVSGAMQPIASRPLAPMVARALAAFLHLSIHGGFFVEAGISLLVLLAVICWLMLGTAAPRWMFDRGRGCAYVGHAGAEPGLSRPLLCCIACANASTAGSGTTSSPPR